jgi:hypothetical protein
MSGTERTITVTRSRPLGWARGSDLARLSAEKLHGMQGVEFKGPFDSGPQSQCTGTPACLAS